METAGGESVLTPSLRPLRSRTLKTPRSFQQKQMSVIRVPREQTSWLSPHRAQGSLLGVLSHQGADVLWQEATLSSAGGRAVTLCDSDTGEAAAVTSCAFARLQRA